MKTSSNPQKILIVCLGAIGDVARALPLAVRIKKSWPSSELHWAVEPISRSLIEHHPALDKILLFDRPKGFPAYLKLLKSIRLEKYDMVLDLQRHFKSGICSFASGSKRRIGFDYQNSRELNWLLNNESILAFPHFSLKIAQYQAFGDYLGLERLSPLEFGLTPSEKELRENSELIARESISQNSIEGSDKGGVALLLGSTWESRFWRADYYVTLILEMWQRWRLVSILVGSRNEKEIAAEITQKVTEKLSAGERLPLVNLVEKTSLRQLVPLFSSTRLAIGSDSGPMHIAAAVSCPLISLWGSTSPLRSAPYGSQDFVIEAKVGCSPCYKKVCPGLGNLCMAEIRPSMVINKVQYLLESKGKQVNAGVFTR